MLIPAVGECLVRGPITEFAHSIKRNQVKIRHLDQLLHGGFARGEVRLDEIDGSVASGLTRDPTLQPAEKVSAEGPH